MGKTRDLFKKIRDTKGTFHAKMGSIEDRNGMDLKIYWRNKNAVCTRPVCKTGMAHAHFFLLLYAFERIHNTKFKNNTNKTNMISETCSSQRHNFPS